MHETAFRPGDWLVFGAETRGLAPALRDSLPPAQRLKLPMRPGQRSLNLSNAVAVTVFEAWRQNGFGLGQAVVAFVVRRLAFEPKPAGDHLGCSKGGA